MTQKKKDALVAPGPAPARGGLSEDRVAGYLRRHPDFFARHADVLAAMTPPARWQGDRVVDMQRFVLERLRDEVESLRACAQEIIETSRSNLSSQTRAHAAVLAMLAAGDFEHMVRVVNDDMPLLLDVDVVAIGFEAGSKPVAGVVGEDIRGFAAGTVDSLLGGADQDVVLVRDMTDDGTVFAAAAGLVHSAALARLRPNPTTPVGLLALGSRKRAFHPGQGTELIRFMARMLECCVHGWREKPA